jgi:hypothetical protein
MCPNCSEYLKDLMFLIDAFLELSAAKVQVSQVRFAAAEGKYFVSFTGLSQLFGSTEIPQESRELGTGIPATLFSLP